jgi:hypothetical protein
LYEYNFSLEAPQIVKVGLFKATAVCIKPLSPPIKQQAFCITESSSFKLVLPVKLTTFLASNFLLISISVLSPKSTMCLSGCSFES